MKKFVVVSALALALLCVAQPRATACNFSFSFGFEISCCCNGCQPCCPPMPYCPDPYACQYAGGYEAYPAGGWAAPQSYPVVNGGGAYPMPATGYQPAAYQPAGFQPVGYTFGAGSYTPVQAAPSYSAPTYWYGQ
jgi:hypothetical protein